jgi:hypothetical protein
MKARMSVMSSFGFRTLAAAARPLSPSRPFAAGSYDVAALRLRSSSDEASDADLDCDRERDLERERERERECERPRALACASPRQDQ